MICPNCGSEYREGFLRCADCDVDLIQTTEESADRIETDPKNELTRVFETQRHDLLIEICLAFENQSIPYLSQSGTAFDTYGVVEQTQTLVWRGAIWVPEAYADEAEQIIEEIQNTTPSEDQIKDSTPPE